jgi:hypothetical protein
VTPTSFPSIVFTLGFAIESIKELGGASWRNSTSQSWCSAFHYSSNKPTSLILNTHFFSYFPIFTQIVIVFQLLSIKLFYWCKNQPFQLWWKNKLSLIKYYIKYFSYFSSILNGRFWRTKTTKGTYEFINDAVLWLSIVSILEKNGNHPRPLNLLPPLFLDQLLVLKSHVLLKNAAISWFHFLCMLKYTKLLQSFSPNYNLEKNLEIGLGVVLDLQFQNVKCGPSLLFEILQ